MTGNTQSNSNSILQYALEDMLHASNVNLAKNQFDIAKTTFSYSKTTQDDTAIYSIAPIKGQTFSVKQLLKLTLGKSITPIIDSLTKDILSDIDVSNIGITFPSDQQNTDTSPIVSVTCSAKKGLDILPNHVSIKPGSEITVYFYRTSLGSEHKTNILLKLTGSAKVFNEDLDVMVSAIDASTWSVQVTDQQGLSLLNLDALGKAVGHRDFDQTVKKALKTINMSFSLSGIQVIVELGKLKPLDIGVQGKISIGGNALDASLSILSEQFSGQLAKPANLALGSLVGDSNAFTLQFPYFDFSIDLKQKVFQSDGAVSLQSDEKVLELIGKAMGINKAILSLSLGVDVEQKSLFFKAQANYQDGAPAVVPVGHLIEELVGSSSKNFTASPINNLGITIPSISINKESDDFAVSVESSVVNTKTNKDYGDMLFNVGKSNSSGFDCGIGIDCLEQINLSDVIPGVSLPSFASMENFFIVFATSPQTFTFPVHDKANQPISVTTKSNNSLGVGANFTLTPKSKPADFVKDLTGNDIDLFVEGVVSFTQLSVNLIAELKPSKSQIQFPTKSMLKSNKIFNNLPVLGFDELFVQLLLTDDDIQFALGVEKLTITVHDTTLTLGGQVIAQLDEVDIAASFNQSKAIPLIDGYQFTFNNIALEIGIGYEGVDPTFGFSGELTFGKYNGFVAFMLDIGDPQNIMVAASINKMPLPTLDLLSLLTDFCPKHVKSSPIVKALSPKHFTITGTQVGKAIPATTEMIHTLNHQPNLRTKRPSIPSEILSQIGTEGEKSYTLTQGKKGSDIWFLTNNNNAMIYQLSVDAKTNTFVINNELQLYIVPAGQVKLANHIFPEGFRLNGAIKVYAFEAQVVITLTLTGFKFDASCTPISFGPQIDGKPALAFKNPKPTKKDPGPVLRIDTYDNPCFQADALIDFFGVTASITADIDENGIAVKEAFSTGVSGCESMTLKSDKWQSFSFTGSMKFAPSVKLPVIFAGGIPIIGADTYTMTLSGTIVITINEQQQSLTISGDLQFMNKTLFSFNNETIDVQELDSLLKAIEKWIEHNTDKVFALIKSDGSELCNLVKHGFNELGDRLGNILRYGYHMVDPRAVSRDLHLVWGVKTQQEVNTILTNLSKAFFTHSQIAEGLNAIHAPTNFVASAFKDILKITDPKTLLHLLTGAGFKDVKSVINSIFHCSCVTHIHVGPFCHEHDNCKWNVGGGCVEHGKCGIDL